MNKSTTIHEHTSCYTRGGQRTARGPDLARGVKTTGPQTIFKIKWNPARGQN